MQLGSLDQLKDHSGSVRAAAFDDFGNWDYDSLEKYKPVLKELFEGGCQAASELLLRMLTNVSEDVRIIALNSGAEETQARSNRCHLRTGQVRLGCSRSAG